MPPRPAKRTVDGLDDPCSACSRRSGDHTLDEWADCLGKEDLGADLPFTEVENLDLEPPDVQSRLREKFKIAGDTIMADHVVVKACMIDGATGNVKVRMPGVIHEFGISDGNRIIQPVANLLYLGSPEVIRKYGLLVRNTANSAANHSERKI